MVIIFALKAKFLAALYTEKHTAIAFRRSTNVAAAEMMPLRKVVTFSTPSIANLGRLLGRAGIPMHNFPSSVS
jgi:hypothetical protein